MSTNFNPSHTECPSCSGCSLHANLGESGLHTNGSNCLLADPASDGPLQGGRFALASLGLFLLPLLLATTGAIVGMGNGATGAEGMGAGGMGAGGMGNPNGQFLGATGGLLIGMVGSIVLARVLRAQAPACKPLATKSQNNIKG